MTSACRAPSKSNVLRNLQTAYRPYFLYDGPASLLQVLFFLSDGFSPACKHESLKRAEGSATTKKEVDIAP